LPTDERNLAHRAATLFCQRAGLAADVSIGLEKRIPAGGGLGGGSSDAAAVLRSLNHLFNIRWPLERLVPLAAQLGSDIPALLLGGTVVARGRGEFVSPLAFDWDGWLVIVMPGIHAATKTVYEDVQPADCRPAASAEDDFKQAARTADGLLAVSRNGLEGPAFRSFPQLADVQERLGRASGRSWRICGSGSSFYTTWDAENQARACARDIQNKLSLRAEAARLERPTPL